MKSVHMNLKKEKWGEERKKKPKMKEEWEQEERRRRGNSHSLLLFTLQCCHSTKLTPVVGVLLMLKLPWRRQPTFGHFDDFRAYKLSPLTHQTSETRIPLPSYF